MANLISYQNGNLTASSWKTVEANTAQATRTTTPTTTTIGYVYNATGAVPSNGTVIEGVALYVRRAGTVGTVSVALLSSLSTIPVRTVAVNTIDLPTITAVTTYGSWMFFKFASTYTCNGTETLKIGVASDIAANAYFFTDSTAGTTNWSRLLRTSTTASPTTADVLYVVGENTGLGTNNPITITMDSTATTAYGTVNIGNLGTLSYGASASTNYYLRLAGWMYIWKGGTLNIGTVGTPIPSTSTAVLEFNCTGSGTWGLENYGGTFNSYGNIGTKVTSAKLDADVAANVNPTSFTTDVTTNWASGDVVCLASTTRTYNQVDSKTVSSSSGTTVNVPSMAYAHNGTPSPYQAEVILLTRNVKVRGVDSTHQGYVYANADATTNCVFTEFYYGGPASGIKWGITIDSSVSTTLTSCSVHDVGAAIYTATASANNVSVTDLVTYATSSDSIKIGVALTGTNWTFNNVITMYSTAASGFNSADAGIILNTVTATSCSIYGFYFTDTSSNPTTYNSMTNIVAHSNANIGMYLGGTLGMFNYTLSNFYSWRNSGDGIYIGGPTIDCTLDTAVINGNVTNNIEFSNYTHTNFIFKSVTSDAYSGYATTTGCLFDANGTCLNMQFINCSFGAVTGHTNDFNFAAGTITLADIILVNTKIAANKITGFTTAVQRETSKLRCTRFNQTANDHRLYWSYGTVATDSTISRTASPSERLTPTAVPTTNRLKFESSPKRVAVPSGTAGNVSVFVRTSVVGDGAAYNGSRARLMLRANPGAGIASDTAWATATVASDGNFEELFNPSPITVSEDTILEFYIDCNGTAGWINVDDWTVSSGTRTAKSALKGWCVGESFHGLKKTESADVGAMKFWWYGQSTDYLLKTEDNANLSGTAGGRSTTSAVGYQCIRALNGTASSISTAQLAYKYGALNHPLSYKIWWKGASLPILQKKNFDWGTEKYWYAGATDAEMYLWQTVVTNYTLYRARGKSKRCGANNPTVKVISALYTNLT